MLFRSKSFYAMSTKLYEAAQAAQQQAGGQPSADNGGAANGDYVDADYVDADDNNGQQQ